MVRSHSPSSVATLGVLTVSVKAGRSFEVLSRAAFLMPLTAQTCPRHRLSAVGEQMALRTCNILNNFFNLKNIQKASNILALHSNATRNKPKLTESSRQFFQRNWEAIFRCWNLEMFRTLSVCNLTGLEQLAGMKEGADWRCLKFDDTTLPNSQQPKRKEIKMTQKNQTVSIASFCC